MFNSVNISLWFQEKCSENQKTSDPEVIKLC